MKKVKSLYNFVWSARYQVGKKKRYQKFLHPKRQLQIWTQISCSHGMTVRLGFNIPIENPDRKITNLVTLKSSNQLNQINEQQAFLRIFAQNTRNLNYLLQDSWYALQLRYHFVDFPWMYLLLWNIHCFWIMT